MLCKHQLSFRIMAHTLFPLQSCHRVSGSSPSSVASLSPLPPSWPPLGCADGQSPPVSAAAGPFNPFARGGGCYVTLARGVAARSRARVAACWTSWARARPAQGRLLGLARPNLRPGGHGRWGASRQQGLGMSAASCTIAGGQCARPEMAPRLVVSRTDLDRPGECPACSSMI